MKIAALSIADYAEATEGMPHDAERLFFRMILKMYSRESGLPDNDRDNARIFGYDIRQYRRLKSVVLKYPCGMSIKQGVICNERVESDLPAIKSRRNKMRKGSISKLTKKEKIRKFETKEAKVGTKSAVSRSYLDRKSVASTPASHIQQCEISRTYHYPSPSPSPSPKERPPKSPRGDLPIYDPFYWQNQLNSSASGGVSFDNGTISLATGARQFWLSEFDDDEKSLRLALLEVASAILPNSKRPVAAQVNAKLSQICQNRLSRQQNYAAAVARNAAKPKKLSRFNT